MSFITVYIAIIACISLAVMKYPSTAVAALLCIFALKQWAQSVDIFFTMHSTFTNYVVACIAVEALIVMTLGKKSMVSCYPAAGWLVLVLFLYSFMSVAWVTDQEVVYKVWLNDLPYVITIILLGPLLVSSTDSVSGSLKALLLLGTTLVLLLLFTSKWTVRGTALKGINILIGQGNPLAVAEMAGYVLCTVVLMNFRGKWRSWQLLRWFVAAACLALTAKSGSRGQFFIMMFATAAFLPLSRKITNPLNLVMIFFGIALLGYLGDWAFHSYSAAGDTRWYWSNMQKDALDRFNSVSKLLGNWSVSVSSVIFGLGNSASFDRRIIGFYPHIVPLEILGEEGIVGFSLFLGMLALTFKNIFRIYELVRLDAEKRGVLAALGALFLFEFLLSFKQGSMMGSPFLFAFIILIGKYKLLVIDESNKVPATVMKLETGIHPSTSSG